jgi:hypothetical protein
MQNTEQSFRAELLARQHAANLPVGDVVMAVLPDGQKKIVWGDDILEAIIRVNRPAKLLMLEIQVDTIDEVRTLADRYCAACDDAAGTC